MSAIYLVCGSEEYEGFGIMRAFHSKKNAEAFADRCRAHYESDPRCPDQEATDAVWDAWERKHRRWADSHPAGKGHSAYSGYHVEKVIMGDAE